MQIYALPTTYTPTVTLPTSMFFFFFSILNPIQGSAELFCRLWFFIIISVFYTQPSTSCHRIEPKDSATFKGFAFAVDWQKHRCIYKKMKNFPCPNHTISGTFPNGGNRWGRPSWMGTDQRVSPPLRVVTHSWGFVIFFLPVLDHFRFPSLLCFSLRLFLFFFYHHHNFHHHMETYEKGTVVLYFLCCE